MIDLDAVVDVVVHAVDLVVDFISRRPATATLFQVELQVLIFPFPDSVIFPLFLSLYLSFYARIRM
jgi:hypothetical protein